jgi:hypothetical protein
MEEAVKNTNPMVYDSNAIKALIQQKQMAMMQPQPFLYQQPVVVNSTQQLTSDQIAELMRRKSINYYQQEVSANQTLNYANHMA